MRQSLSGSGSERGGGLSLSGIVGRRSLPLRSQITCPHCWHRFPPDQILWISAHSELRGDPLLGADAQQRFLPTRFDIEGHALDVRGVACHELACPRCHLAVSRALLEMVPLFLSILGAPGSGKSYFLASMTWQLRKTLAGEFGLSFADADPMANQILNDYEERLFLNPNDDQLVALPKTEKEGDLYEMVQYGDRIVSYPKPFVFSIQPLESHPANIERRRLARALCLYDNAGEHFLPGGQTPNSPGTEHLAHSSALLFLFDPTQHPRFRLACRGKSRDPQITANLWSHRQDQVLLEAANRIRSRSGLAQHEKYDRPLIVVVTKYDAWSPLVNPTRLRLEWVVRRVTPSMSGLDVETLQSISGHVRMMLSEHAPELVSAAESFSREVVYIPVSSLGGAPHVDAKTGLLGSRPCDIRPQWTDLPLLYALYRSVGGLVPSIKAETVAAGNGSPTETIETTQRTAKSRDR